MPVLARVSAFCLLLFVSGGLPTFMALGTDLTQGETSTVLIQARQFTPDRMVLHQGQKTTLVFKNQDSELHSVVPFGLFSGMSLIISGNGASEFAGDVFKRVIIPPDGITEIHFTPTEPGEYRYHCDMPGHEMKAVIVEE